MLIVERTYSYHHKIQDVPDIGEVPNGVLPDLNHLLNEVVDDVSSEDEFTCHDKVVQGSHIAEEFHSAEGERGNHAASRRELKHNSGKNNR